MLSTSSRLSLVLAALTGCGFGMPTPLAPALSGSVGLPHHGVVTNAKAISDRGEGYVRFRSDDIRWGLPRLVTLIDRSALAAARALPGSPLVVGDLSAKHGGVTERHRSHRSGRDVDLLFYVMSADGRRIRSPGFVKFGADGLAENEEGRPSFVRFDTEKNWTLVKALLSDPEIPIQWIFVARPLEAMLLEYARAKGEPIDLLFYAATVLQQPGDSAKHDDHFHLRLACLPEEMIAGCWGGPAWPFHGEVPMLVMTDEEVIAAALEEGPP